MCNIIKQYGPLLGRIFISVVFIIGSILKARTFEISSSYLASQGVGFSDAVLVLIISIEMIGGTLILIGLKARIAAMGLFLYLIVATLFFHPYWTFEGAELMKHFHLFFRNLAIMGGMVFVMVHGSGPLSIENKLKKPE
jgi:putative oxidoreductase